MFSAWGDESESNSASDPGVYIMAAAVAETTAAGSLRDAMTALRGSELKLHWRNESPARRDVIVAALCELPVEGLVVVRAGALTETPSRRRSKCLVELVRATAALGCGHLTLESRGPADDRRDRVVVDRVKAHEHALGRVRLEHVPGPKDPALWIADVLCGVVVQARTGNPSYLTRLERRVTVQVTAP